MRKDIDQVNNPKREFRITEKVECSHPDGLNPNPQGWSDLERKFHSCSWCNGTGVAWISVPVKTVRIEGRLVFTLDDGTI
jgi:hypothetical protein